MSCFDTSSCEKTSSTPAPAADRLERRSASPIVAARPCVRTAAQRTGSPTAAAIQSSSASGVAGSSHGRGGGRTRGCPSGLATRSLRRRRHVPAAREPRQRPRAHAPLDRRVAHDALPHLRPARLELRLHEHERLPAGRASPSTGGSTTRSEMNETSHVTSTGAYGSGQACGRSSARARHTGIVAQTCGWSWPWPTSSAITRAAPCWSRQSVKPPVDAPTSRHPVPATSRPKASSAFASFSPPRETNGGGRATSSSTSSSSCSPPSRAPGRARPGRGPAPARALGEAALDEQDVEALLHRGSRTSRSAAAARRQSSYVL